jgi:hypothetical protein
VQKVDPETIINLPGAGSLTWSGKTFTGWNTNAGGTGTSYAEGATYTVNANSSFYAQWNAAPVVPQGSTLAEKLAWIAGRADDGVVYDIEISADEYVDQTIVSTNGKNVTLIMRSASTQDIKTIQIYSTGTLFTINNNITVKLRDINLKGRSANNAPLVKVSAGGILSIESGGVISDNKTTANGGGIIISGGAVILDGGKIINNSAANDGGGAYLETGGKLTIKSGEISGNHADRGGGGALAEGVNCQITMNGGIVKNNNANFGGAFALYGYEGCHFVKCAVGSDPKSGVVYGGSAGEGLANTSNPSLYAYCSAIYYQREAFHEYGRKSTLGEFDEISTQDLSKGWE